MPLTKVPQFHFPRRVPAHCGAWASGVFATGGLIDANTDKFHMTGAIEWADGGASKTLDQIIVAISAASSPTGNLRASLQTPRAASGSAARGGDGTADVYGEVTAPTAAGVVAVTMTNGSDTYSTGDIVAVVIESPNLSAGSFTVGALAVPYAAHDPAVALNTGTANVVPSVLLKATDGIYGTLRGASFIPGTIGSRAFADASDPDEYGIVFKVPFQCKVAGIWFHGFGDNRGTSTLSAALYATPTNTPNALATVTPSAGQLWHATGASIVQLWFGSEITLDPDTLYAVAIKASGSTNVNISETDLGTAAYAGALPGGTDVYEVSRTGGSGNFSQVSASTFLHMGIIVSQVIEDASAATWSPGTGSAGTHLKLTAHSSAASASSISGVVFMPGTGQDITGVKVGEFTGQTFEASLEGGLAVLKVPLSAFGGTGMTVDQTPVALVRNANNTTGIVSCTVIAQ